MNVSYLTLSKKRKKGQKFWELDQDLHKDGFRLFKYDLVFASLILGEGSQAYTYAIKYSEAGD